MKIVPQLNVKYSEFKVIWDHLKRDYNKNYIINFYQTNGPFMVKWGGKDRDSSIHFIIRDNKSKIIRYLKLPHAFMTFINSKRVFNELLEQII